MAKNKQTNKQKTRQIVGRKFIKTFIIEEILFQEPLRFLWALPLTIRGVKKLGPSQTGCIYSNYCMFVATFVRYCLKKKRYTNYSAWEAKSFTQVAAAKNMS